MIDKRKPRLGREITVLLAIKVVVLLGLFFAFFSPAHRLHPDRQIVADHLIGTSKS